jgi:hypothetical protein
VGLDPGPDPDPGPGSLLLARLAVSQVGAQPESQPGTQSPSLAGRVSQVGAQPEFGIMVP